jgi:LmbE family N-acetylglucosaminyl deacetylase
LDSCFDRGIAEGHGSGPGATLVAISPHLDDVVLGCADLVSAHPGAVVVTVTAGKPGPHPLTDWDRKCGFAEGDDVIGARRSEDEAALRHLGARPAWLDFLDRQYMGGDPPSRFDVALAIEAAVRAADADLVASPLGFGHPDHVVTAAACLDVARRRRRSAWLLYEDAIYRVNEDLAAEALSRLAADGFVVERLAVAAGAGKRAAVESYRSQVQGLGDLLNDAFRPERYWKVVARP